MNTDYREAKTSVLIGAVRLISTLAKCEAKLRTARRITTSAVFLCERQESRWKKSALCGETRLEGRESASIRKHRWSCAPQGASLLLAVRRQPTDAVLHPAHISRASGDVAGLFATSPLARLHWFVNHRFPWVGTHG